MRKTIKYISLAAMLILIATAGCEKKYSFGSIVTPTGLAITTVIQGAGSASPNGDGSGNVTITATAGGAIAYKIYFGSRDSAVSSAGTFVHQYTLLDTNQYTIVVNAIGKGGVMSTAIKQIKVYYLFPIPAATDSALTNGSSKVWMVAHDTAGSFGVGPNTTFTPDYYSAAPNQEPGCSYAGTITFTHVGPNNISMNVDNLGSTFMISAAAPFYGQSGPDNCYPLSTVGAKTVTFGVDQFLGSNPSNSTGLQITIPGNGIINYGTGANVYEILYLSPTVISLRNIGIDGNAWYQILRAK